MTPDDEAMLGSAEDVLGYRFRERALLLAALTHRSFVNEAPDPLEVHNERLEFLGDAVLGFCAADRLYRGAPDAVEGVLTRRRAAYVSEAAISQRPGPVALGRLVRMGRGQARAQGHALPSIIADVTEAVIGAVYLDGGLEAVTEVIDRLLGPPPEATTPPDNSKTRLQELLQRLVAELPTYRCERVAGPDHAPRFRAEVEFGSHTLGSAEGASKKDATLAAAEDALGALTGLDDEAVIARLRSQP